MSVLTAIIIMGSVLLGIVLLCFGATWLEKQKKSDVFDERQQLVRGRGYGLAFLVGLVCLLVILTVLVGQVDGKKTVEPYLLVFASFMIQGLVFHVYCLINQAVLPFSSKPALMILVYLFNGIVQILPYRNSVKENPLSFVGHGSAGWIWLIAAFSFFSLALMHLIQLLRREKE